jgi:hypothetical protein
MAKEPIPKTHTGAEGWFIWTPNLKLASCLFTAGFARIENGIPVITSKPDGRGGTQYLFWFIKTNQKGESIANYLRWFDYPEELEAINDDHPFLHARATAINRERYLQMINNASEVVQIKRGKATLLLTRNASQDVRNKARSL